VSVKPPIIDCADGLKDFLRDRSTTFVPCCPVGRRELTPRERRLIAIGWTAGYVRGLRHADAERQTAEEP